MWETFISWYINAYLGSYLEDLNSQQLTFAMRQGELELENVPLKKNIFRAWGLPIEIQSSIVGRIKIEFNLMKYFRNEPVLISMEDVYLVAGSINLENWNPLDEDALVIEAKMNSLDAHEARWKARFDLATSSSSYSSLYFSSIRIGASIVTKIVENLHLNVKNVHIRFEEECDGRVIAFGITLEGLNAESCDAQWNSLSSPVTEPGPSLNDCSFKTLQLNNFGIYCDTNTKQFNKVLPQELKQTMQDSCTNHTYLVCPVSAEARITKNNSSHPLTSAQQPRFNVYLTLEKVPLQLTDSQYRNILHWYKSFTRLRRNCRLRHYRPFEPLTGSVKLWWIYAVRAILTVRGRKQRTVLKSWDEMLDRCRDNVAYVSIYQQHLHGEVLSHDSAKVKERIEMEQHFDDVIALREIAMRKVEQIQQKKEASTEVTKVQCSEEAKSGSIFSYLFPSWASWATSSSDAGSKEEDTKETNPEQSIQRTESFDDAILDDARSFGSDALLAKFRFIMRKSMVTLNRMSGPFLELDVCDVDILAQLKPRSGSHKFQMTVASMFLRDCTMKSVLISPHNSVSSVNSSSDLGTTAQDPIFSLLYEREPIKKLGHRIGMTTKPLDIILFPKTWNEVNLYFTNFSYSQDDIELFDSGYEIMKQRTRDELKRYWERLINLREVSKDDKYSQSWEIQLDISAPQIVMHSSNETPSALEKGFSCGRFIMIDLGKFRFTNKSIETSGYMHRERSHTNVSSDEDDEEFVTPCTSPMPSPIASDSNSAMFSSATLPKRTSFGSGVGFSSDSIGDLREKLYKIYRLEVTDIQVLVVDTSTAFKIFEKRVQGIPLVDRFSVDLELRRCLIRCVDPQWPSLKAVATLPKLSLHFDEHKIQTVRAVLNSFVAGVKDGLTQPNITKPAIPRVTVGSPGTGPSLRLKQSHISTYFATEFRILSLVTEVQLNGFEPVPQIVLTCSDLNFNYEKEDCKTELSVSVCSLVLEDFSVAADSPQRYLAVSKTLSTSDGQQLADGTLQAELHIRQTAGGSNMSVILNNMRLMVVLDWWMKLFTFLSQEIPLPDETSQGGQGQEIKYEALAVSAGIVSKRAPILDIRPTTFELKVNISQCEIVVVEDCLVWDTNAIILKSSAAFHYRPHLEQLVYINLFECELFTCILGLESDTALSIVDPTKNIVLEIVKKSSDERLGILDATLVPTSFMKMLKIQSPALNMRLSYYDMKMFIQLVDRFSKDVQSHFLKESNWDLAASTEDVFKDLPPISRELDRLVEMGFPKEESLKVLEECEGRLDDAALILSSGKQADKLKERKDSIDSGQSGHTVSSEGESSHTIRSINLKDVDENRIYGLEFKCIGGLSLCVIDDCKDADVPLIELTISHLEFSRNFAEKLSKLDGILSGDYYNRQLSGWEPFLEPWKFSLSWKQNQVGQLGRVSPTREFPLKLPRQEITMNSNQVMNINITSTLVSLYETVSFNWSEEYSKVEKRRSPFIPFALKNETGSPLWFTTILSSNDEIFRQQKLGTSHTDGKNWIQVNNGRVQSFSFEQREKLRHRNMHRLKAHQLVIRVDGWQESDPVSVDKVGTYFRTVKPILAQGPSRFTLQGTELPPTKLIFEVSLQGSAQKLVRVRSSLRVKNELPDPMELKLENTIIYPGFQKAQTGGSVLLTIDPGQVCAVPLHSVYAQMWIRPHRTLERTTPSIYMYSTKPLVLGENKGGLRTCCPMVAHQSELYRFCVATKRDKFPTDADEPVPTVPTRAQMMNLGMARRPNLVTLKCPLVVSNLLPQELYFEIKEYGINCRLGPGEKFPLINVDTSEYVEILFRIDNFPNGTSIGIQPNSSDFVARLKILDVMKRPLYLSGRVERKEGGSIRLSLSCPYWIINKSGIPIICKQEGTLEAAGQFKEHEMGRMVTPLLFSFTDFDNTSALTLRVGSNLHGQSSKPHWCTPFSLQRESVRKLAVTISHSQPEIIYLVGVEVKDGKGRDTKQVTITPRFLVDNRSSNTVQISQRNFATSFMDPAAEATHLTLPPECSLPFHWPRLDKDLLLCVRLLNLDGSCWAGGFPIENVDSFHINIRDGDGNCHFLRVEIVVQGPTYVVVFSDTDKLPAPFRIDNLSLVPITFHQSSVGDDRKVSVRPESSCPYAWDEISQQPNITIVAPGQTCAIANMNHLGPVASLTYENFFFIALTATFPKEDWHIGGSGMETMQLVLDVSGTKVSLSRKEPGNRNQLWRVNANGLIEHEGSSPPRDSKKGSSPRLVLDIAGSAPQPSSYIPLMLRKPDTRRASTQHWEFTDDGRLKCANYANLFVQAKDGFGANGEKQEGAWRQWNEIVLGPPQSICFVRTDSGIPVEQAIGRQKLRAGSGRLEVCVDTDGPTRVLRIVDVGKKQKGPILNHIFEENYVNSIPNFVLNLNLQSGIGASLISCQPREELLYLRLFTLYLRWNDSKESETVEASVQNFQVDNQLLGSEKPNCIFVIPLSSRYYDPELDQPALLLNWRRLKTKLNAHVFRNWLLTLKPLSIILEEALLLKFCSWIGLAKNYDSLEVIQGEHDFQIQQSVTNATSLTAKRWYFGLLQIALNQVRLSVLTAPKLSPDLALVKQRLGLTLIRFEEALVELDSFKKEHPFETFEFLNGSIIKHYKDELLSQVLLVLGSVDFLGNPVGFVNDVSVGVSGLIHEGSVGFLVKNVTHGISNSAAKVTSSLGDGLGRTLTLDDRHELERRKIMLESNSSGDQFIAGLRGLGHGVFGGLTSIFTQTYEGVNQDGIALGLISGLSKGIIGTVTKPAVGVLDFATGAASAIRDSSKTSSRRIPKRMRSTRVIIAGDLLPPFSESASQGQELLFEINDRNYDEVYIGHETFKSGVQDLQILVSNEHARIIRPGSKGRPVLVIHLKDLIECQNVIVQRKHFIQFLTRIPDGHLGVARPQVLVENEQIAKKIVQQVNYAKLLFEEMRHSLNSTSPSDTLNDD